MIVASPSSLYSDLDVSAQVDAPLAEHTWFGIGGRADLLVRPNSIEALVTLARRCRRDGIPLRVLGSGANLLVDDEGVDGVVVKLDTECFRRVEFNADGIVERMRVFGGASMEKLVQDSARRGLRGLEPMSGIPASLGGAIRMNAGGKFGAIGDVVDAVAVLGADGEQRVFTASELRFGYRESNLPAGIVLWASLRVAEDDPIACRERVKEIFAYKKSTQPMAAHSAGCMFRNPVMPDGSRVSAGKLIDLAGLKGTRVGCAFVSAEHGNFIAIDRKAGAPARTDDLRELVDLIKSRVLDGAKVELQTEVVFWRRGEAS
ncbi:MAG: UDP-N-acetylmuramate dehydrogenase [Phycisphaerales bacterium]